MHKVLNKPTKMILSLTTLIFCNAAGNYAMPSELGAGRHLGAWWWLSGGDVAVLVGSLAGAVVVAGAVATYCYCHTLARRKAQQGQKGKTAVPGGTVCGNELGVDGNREAGMCGNGMGVEVSNKEAEVYRGGRGDATGCLNDTASKNGGIVCMGEAGSRAEAGVVNRDNLQRVMPGGPTDNTHMPSNLPARGTSTLPRRQSTSTEVSRNNTNLQQENNITALPPFPDVTVTDYPRALADNPTYRGGGGTEGGGESQPPMHLVLTREEITDGAGGPGTWHEPLSCHLLSRVNNGNNTQVQQDRIGRSVTRV